MRGTVGGSGALSPTPRSTYISANRPAARKIE
jgi:hypothetical protein